MAITLVISDDQLQNAFEKSMDEMLKPGNYNNPVKTVLDNILGYSGQMKGEVGKQIQEFVTNSLSMPLFQAKLGQAIADEMARRAVDAMEKKGK
jgi:hypothetical protein